MAMCSLCGENRIAEIESSGGELKATSFDVSPWVLLAAALALPKMPDILE